MKHKTVIFFIFSATFFLLLTHAVSYEVRFVYDGDTILLDNEDRVRYLGIDAPEIDHKFHKDDFMAHDARDFNSKLVNGATLRLEYDKQKRDQYGRLLAYVFLKNGEMINDLLVQKGLAYVMSKNGNLKYRDFLLNSQRKAMKKRLGIWSRDFKGDEKFYAGNRGSYLFHRPGCPFGRDISKKNLVQFGSRYDAFWEGYSPCRRCRP